MPKQAKPKARAGAKAPRPKPAPRSTRADGRASAGKAKTSAAARPRSVAKAQAKPLASRGKTPAQKRPKRVSFDRQTLASIKDTLHQMRSDLEEELREIEEAAFNLSQSDLSGEVSYDEDYADSGSFTFEREKDLSIANNVQDLLSKVARALEKIEQGTYGICESCGEPIEPARLKALPHVLLCVKCKTAEERR